MKVIIHIVEFFSNGSRVFRIAARGRYDEESEAVALLRDEVFSNQATDRQRLRQDFAKVGRDWRMAADKVANKNG